MRRSLSSTFCTACLIVAFAACGPTGSGGSGGNSGGSSGSGSGGSGGTSSGGSSGNGSGGSGGGGGIDHTPDAMNCGVQTFTPTAGLPPDLLIVLDKSGSMMDPPSTGGASKWQQITTAINSSVSALQGQIKWGLEFFPSDQACGTGAPQVPVAMSNATPIANAIAGQGPGGSTPTAAAVRAGSAYLLGLTDQNPKFIVLATDGAPNCASSGTDSCLCLNGTMPSPPCPNGCFTIPGGAGGPDNAGANQAITDAKNMGVNTFVIGISAAAADDMELNAMAMAGGEARPNGPPYYYAINSQTDFQNAINSIAGMIISCNLQLPMRPPYPDQVTVTANGQTVPRDTTHMNGWDFGPGDMSIQFYGSYCSMLQSGGITNVQAIYGCPPIGIHR